MKSKKYEGLSKNDRNEIEALLNRHYGIREIAQVLNRSPNTISYEVRVNSVDGEYVASKAHSKA